MFRYFAVAWDDESSIQRKRAMEALQRLTSREAGWQQVYQARGLAVLCAGVRPQSLRTYALKPKGGVILGTLFKKSAGEFDESAASHASFDESESTAIVVTKGRRLVTEYWGNYVAFLTNEDQGKKWIIKDPTGSLPCLWAEREGLYSFCSDLKDLVSLNLIGFSVNWDCIADHVVGSWLSAEGQPLRELNEVIRGECLEIPQLRRSPLREFYWNPCSIIESAKPVENIEVATALLRRTVRHCLQTWKKCHDNIILQLSGGLDSSIVLGCLNSTPVDDSAGVVCFNYYGENRGSNAQKWARIAAKAANRKLVEFPLDGSRVSLTPLLNAARTPAPSWMINHLIISGFLSNLAQEHNATAIFTGNGGDSNFGSLCIGASIDDFLKRRGLNMRAVRLASMIAANRDTTTLSVLAGALRRRMFGEGLKEHAKIFEDTGRMAPPALRQRAISRRRFSHPWFQTFNEAPWGLLMRLGALIASPEFYNPLSNQDDVGQEVIDPLYSQPVVELCLTIPLDVHFFDGRDRGLARTAFAADVPAEILKRQWKDRGTSTTSAIISSNLSFLREILLNGQLVREKLLDRRLLEESLSTSPTSSNFVPSVILQYMHIELWLRQWAGRSEKLAA